jgi:GH35 family endo-1,4-beta-xylanase
MGSTFHLGFKKQKIEIGGAIALNMGSEVSDDDLPQNDIFYEGMEEDAAWRIEAEAGIEANRKANISIEVMDKDGNPIEGASISMQMKKHHFGFGSFISDLLLANSSDGDKYREHFIDLFNVGTTPFYMGGNNDNWGWYGSSTSRTNYPKFAEWFKDNNIPAKGHVLVWPAWEWMPSYFEDLGNEPAALEEAISDHLDLIVPIGKQNNLYEWDVLNEPFINHDVMDILGEEIMVQWFNHVRNLDSNPKLIMNEYNIIQGGGRADFQDNFIRLINYLKDQAAPLGGIGMQCHFDENLTGITAVLATLDRFGELGLPIQITEFDIDTRDEEIQAAYTRDFYTAVFSHPAAEKIVMWGFYETTMWKPNGALVRPDWSHKPNYDVYKDLVYNQWWNEDIEGLTNSEGNFTARGFKGRYDISIITADTSYSIEINMKDEANIEIRGSEIDKMVVGIENLKEETSGEISTYPNPFTTSTNIRYTLEKASKVNFKLFNYNGQLVRELNQNQSQAGTFEIELNGHDLEPGIYMCMAKAENSHFRDNSIVLLKLE